MTITRIEQGDRMSQAVVHGDTIYLAGQVGTPGAGVEQQTSEVLSRSTTCWPVLAAAATTCCMR